MLLSALILATAVDSSKYLNRLRNLVGSLHFWHADGALPQIVVYDLGLAPADRAAVARWRRAEVRDVDWDALPAGARHNLHWFVWKPWAMRDALALAAARGLAGVLYQDAGQEARRPLQPVADLLARQGHFFVVQDGRHTQLQCCGTIGELTHDGTQRALGVTAAERAHTMCAGGIQGYLVGDRAVADVLEPTWRCAARGPACMTPPGATLGNHRFDQSVFSVHLARANIECTRDPAFWTNRGNMRSRESINSVTEDHRQQNRALLFSRRGWGWDYDQTRGGAATPAYVQHLRHDDVEDPREL